MSKLKRFEVRRSVPHNLALAVIGGGLGLAATAWALMEWTGTTSLVGAPASEAAAVSDGRIMWMLLCAGAMFYYAVRAAVHLRERNPHIVIDRSGVTLGFGRNVTIPWESIHWLRVRGLRGTLQVGVDAEVAVGLRLSLWNLDDNLTLVPGTSGIGIRSMGLDHSMREVADVMTAFKPALARAVKR